MHEHDEDEEEYDTVVLEDDEGNPTEYAIWAVVELRGKEYAVLAPVEQIEAEDDVEIELSIYAMETNENGDYDILPIEDEALFDEVRALCEEQFSAEE